MHSVKSLQWHDWKLEGEKEQQFEAALMSFYMVMYAWRFKAKDFNG